MAAKRGGGRIKTVVYLDVLLLTNFLLAYFQLLAAGTLSGQRAGFGRMLAGSGLAALSALVLFAPPQPYPVQAAYKIATALGITAAAFGRRSLRRLLTAACWYAALNIALAGGGDARHAEHRGAVAGRSQPDGLPAHLAAAAVGAVRGVLCGC